jgi:hypothetical protein
VLRGLQRLLVTVVGDVLEKSRQSMAGDEEWRQPCRGARGPGEGPANMGEHGAHEHRESTGMLSPCSI